MLAVRVRFPYRDEVSVSLNFIPRWEWLEVKEALDLLPSIAPHPEKLEFSTWGKCAHDAYTMPFSTFLVGIKVVEDPKEVEILNKTLEGENLGKYKILRTIKGWLSELVGLLGDAETDRIETDLGKLGKTSEYIDCKQMIITPDNFVFGEVETIKKNKYLPQILKYSFKGVREGDKIREATPEEIERPENSPSPKSKNSEKCRPS